jgi:hypothetical protein
MRFLPGSGLLALKHAVRQQRLAAYAFAAG